MTKFRLTIVSPERTVVEDTVESLIVPAHLGYLGIMGGHEPMVCALRAGILEYVAEDRHFVSIGGGFLEVSENQASILADTAEVASEIDLEAAMADLEEARRALRGESSRMTRDEATVELDRAIARVKAARMK